MITATGQGTLATTCFRTTLKPYTTIYTIPNGGPTIVYTFTGPNVKRNVATAALAPTPPSCASGRPAATLSAACSCLSAENPTTTVTSITMASPTTVSNLLLRPRWMILHAINPGTTGANELTQTYTTVTSPTYTYYYPATTTIYSATVTTTSTSYSAISTTYKLNHNGTYKAQNETYNIYDNYRFDFVSAHCLPARSSIAGTANVCRTLLA